MKNFHKGNVTITPLKKGYFLTINDKMTEYQWAVTFEELVGIKELVEELMEYKSQQDEG